MSVEEMSEGPVLALAADMLFASRIRGAAQAAGVADVISLRSTDAVLDAARERTPRLILLDLAARSGDVPALIRSLKADERTRATPVVAFVSHVDEAAIAAARGAGADRVLARSAFVRELPALLRGSRGG